MTGFEDFEIANALTNPNWVDEAFAALEEAIDLETDPWDDAA